MRVLHDMMVYTSILSGHTAIHQKIITVIPYHLILNAFKMLQSTSAIMVADGVAINAANDVLPVYSIEKYPFRINQSKSLFNAAVKR